jgi:hypothetical protein
MAGLEEPTLTEAGGITVTTAADTMTAMEELVPTVSPEETRSRKETKKVKRKYRITKIRSVEGCSCMTTATSSETL